MQQVPSTDYEKVELYISCRNLKNMDFFSKSDPQVRLYTENRGQWVPIGATEVINDNLNPNFVKNFTIDFIFEVQQNLKFEVVDIDGPTSFDFIGSIETTLGKIMGSKKQTLVADILNKSGKKTGKIIIRGERQGISQNLITWQWSGVKLYNTDGWFFDKSDPFLRFFKKREDGEWLQVHETETIMNNLNPVWKAFQIKDDKLCGSNYSRPIRVECWDWESDGKNQYIGDCEITLEQLKNRQNDFPLYNAKKKKKTGTLRLLSFAIIEKPSFLEYIRGGEQLNVVVAIDFTGSNGHPNMPTSLHARNVGGAMNQYQQAINSVCQILLNYDYDQNVPVFGFGGKPHYPSMSSNMVSHCFPCSGNMAQTEVHQLDGILNVYNYALSNVELAGPTYFAPIITEAMKLAQQHKIEESGVYTILLILTDGEIHDMDQTIDAVCNASHLPLSIIIVGVGNADFTKMEILDGDNGLYNTRGEKAQRDLVQFVPFRNFKGDMIQLARHVLAEVPDQLVEYMMLVKRKPRPPLMADINNMQFSSLQTLGTMGPQQQPGGPGPNFVIEHIESNPDLNAQVLAQNPYLMNAGTHLVQNTVGSLTTSINSSPMAGQMQGAQPGWSPQQANVQQNNMYVSLNSFPQGQNPQGSPSNGQMFVQNQQGNGQQFAQNPYLMNAGMFLVQQAVNGQQGNAFPMMQSTQGNMNIQPNMQNMQNMQNPGMQPYIYPKFQ